jgi:hypothetical protein
MELKRNEMIELRGDDAFDLPPVRKLKQDVPSRRNSTYSMIKSVFDAHDCIKTVINNNLLTYFEISLIFKCLVESRQSTICKSRKSTVDYLLKTKSRQSTICKSRKVDSRLFVKVEKSTVDYL